MITIDVNIIAKDAAINLENVSQILEARFQTALHAIVISGYNEMIRLASERLNETRQFYIKALRGPEEIAPNTYRISLTNSGSKGGLPPTWIEGGFARFDMKPGMLAGPKARVAKDGTRYNIIPFTHSPTAAPRTLAQSIQQQGLKAILAANKLNRTVRNAQGHPIQGTAGTVRSTAAGKPWLIGQKLKNLQGLIKVQKTYGKATQSQYLTFRIVSSKSPANSWIHPGYEGAHIFPDTAKYMEHQIQEAMSSILGST